MSGVSTPILLASVFFTGLSAFGAGYLLSPPTIRTIDTRPIVDPEAWNRTAPQHFEASIRPAHWATAQARIARTEMAQTDIASGDPLEVADVAMENVRDDLERANLQPQGRPSPEDAEDAFAQDDTQAISASGSYSVDQLDGGGSANSGASTIMVLDDADAERAWDGWSGSAASERRATTAPAQ